ncbi:MAG: hybrid sensor histidine kinase/response regulator [Deltaproteobacteria bacterium]
MACAHILLVDDDPAVRTAMSTLLRSRGFTTSTAADGEAALSAVRYALPDVVLTDVQMPRMNGAELCQRLREIDPDLPVIVVTGHSSMQSVVGILRAGAEDYLFKPFESDALFWCVERALTRRAEQRERAALDRALRLLEQQRDEYLGLVSHDLRNPLSSISRCVSMLRLALEKKAQTDAIPVALLLKYAERADRNVQRMSLMLEALTEESTSLQTPGAELRRQTCDLRGLIANVVDSLDDTRAPRITIDTDEAPGHEVLGDASRLERVIANLLSNALEYSPPGSPVAARLARRGDNVELEVIDRGSGLAPESVAMIVAKYDRAADGKSKTGGLGLGLNIVQRIVAAHGGRIEVASELGKGSTFRLILPCRPDARADGPSGYARP